jgi:hypothetical protein
VVAVTAESFADQLRVKLGIGGPARSNEVVEE